MLPSLADRVFARLVRRQPLFWGGWGDESYVDAVRTRAARFESAPPASVHYTPLRAGSEIGGRVRHGRFLSPMTRLEGRTRRGALLRIDPPRGVASKGAFVALAGAGEEGYTLRRMLWAPLVEEGYTAVFLENPFYGTRRSPRQRTVAVETVAEHLTLSAAVVAESCALLGHLEREGFRHLGIAGFSMGAFHTALVAAVSQRPLAVATLAGGVCPKDVFTESLFARSVPFAALGRAGETVEATRARVKETFGITVEEYERPPVPAAFRCVGLLRDGFVAAEETRRLATWVGAPEPIWIDAGHTDGLVRARRALRQALREAFETLEKSA